MSSPAYQSIRNELAAGRVVVIDGATGTELERRGAPMHDDVWCATATLAAPDILRQIHEDYIRAGARVITANTFSTSLNMLEPAGLADRFEELVDLSVGIALEARDRAGAADSVVVAGSMSHQVPLTPGADHRDPASLPSPDRVAANHRRMAERLAGAGVELIMLEMMSDPAYANPAFTAARDTGLPVWMGYSCRAAVTGEPCSWTIEAMAMLAMLEAIPPTSADAAGIMHTRADLVGTCLKHLRDAYSGPLTAYPDTGHFEMPNWVWSDAIEPAALVDAARRWVDEGAQVLGGCCGTGIEHIEALSELASRS